MPAKNAMTESDGFSAEERAAIKVRAAELRAEGKAPRRPTACRRSSTASRDGAGGSRARRAGACDRDLDGPELSSKTWYGMPAYENADGKVVVFFQDAASSTTWYSTLGFQDPANLDDGDMWPVAYALTKWSPAVERKVVELVKSATS